jgi:hypothetical protein
LPLFSTVDDSCQRREGLDAGGVYRV